MNYKYYKPVCPVCFHDSMGKFGINSEVDKICKVCKSVICVCTSEENVSTTIIKANKNWVDPTIEN